MVVHRVNRINGCDGGCTQGSIVLMDVIVVVHRINRINGCDGGCTQDQSYLWM